MGICPGLKPIWEPGCIPPIGGAKDPAPLGLNELELGVNAEELGVNTALDGLNSPTLAFIVGASLFGLKSFDFTCMPGCVTLALGIFE